MKKALENLVHQRTNDICMTISENEEFIECDKKEQNLLEAIENMIPDDERYMVSELNDVFNYKTAICEEAMYKGGFCDCMKFIEAVDKNGQKTDKNFGGAKNT